MHWIMGSAETGKSFLLTQFAQHYKQMGYKIIRLAPTVVTAYNIQEAINNIPSGLISVTDRHRRFGGIAVILFGDVGQLLPVSQSHPPPSNF
ncbi:hypothetical protein PS6_008177 [Mucor atramentarius]